QVTAGGVDLSDINTNTMESKKSAGLYFIGEVLDVDGICGGYNLTWAYTSATLAANDLIKVIKC
ncbi:MAG: NAD(P)/FAD-dependent oxidoreductase, partial [Pseudobutyrivibrio sp.]|uniref:NAD(P)/FAD-dependent oxidoreductase n=1 Tax=Pseudobutyrivibrio sp. TaxID=2014367 RepID=UPI0025F2BCEC